MRSTYYQIRFSASDLAIASSRTIQVVYAGFVCIASYRFLLGVWIEISMYGFSVPMDCDKYLATDTEPFLPCGLLTSNFMVHIIAGYAKPGKTRVLTCRSVLATPLVQALKPRMANIR